MPISTATPMSITTEVFQSSPAKKYTMMLRNMLRTSVALNKKANTQMIMTVNHAHGSQTFQMLFDPLFTGFSCRLSEHMTVF